MGIESSYLSVKGAPSFKISVRSYSLCGYRGCGYSEDFFFKWKTFQIDKFNYGQGIFRSFCLGPHHLRCLSMVISNTYGHGEDFATSLMW